MSLSIVLPAYNESGNLVKLVEEIRLSLKNYNYEIIIVNDCSTDDTSEIIKNLKIQNDIVLFTNQKNMGQSYSIYKGIKNASYNIIVTLDADGQNDPADIPKLYNKYLSDKNIFLVGGIRKKRNDSIVKIFSSKIANKIRNIILQDNCLDTGCSLKVFDKKILLKFPFFDGLHRFLPALFSGYGKETFFIDVNHRSRNYGVSKYGTFGRGIRGVRDLFKVLKIIKEFKRNRA